MKVGDGLALSPTKTTRDTVDQDRAAPAVPDCGPSRPDTLLPPGDPLLGGLQCWRRCYMVVR